jgi:hypothetical protein
MIKGALKWRRHYCLVSYAAISKLTGLATHAILVVIQPAAHRYSFLGNEQRQQEP